MDIRDLQQCLPQAAGLSRPAGQLGAKYLSTKQQGWDYAASTRPPTVASSATEDVGTLRALALSAVAPPFVSKLPEITSCLLQFLPLNKSVIPAGLQGSLRCPS